MARVITDFLEESANKFSYRTAFVDSEKAITFYELREQALHIANGLIDTHCFKQPIGIYLDKGICCITAMFGTAYSGNFYTILDTAMPVSRIKKIISTLMPEVILTDCVHAQEVKQFSESTKILIIEQLLEQDCNPEKIITVTNRVTESDVLYVLFTSGSTGVPKGVITSHRAVISYMDAVTDAYNLSCETIIGNQAPFYFVLSIIDIFCTIRNGGITHIIPPSYFTFPGKLVKYIAENEITLLNWVSSALSVVASFKAFEKADISCVNTVIFGGEVMPIKHLNAWMQALPNTSFINGYGSTEVTDSATYYIVNRRFKETDLLPLGNALPNTSILVLNEMNKEARKGETGELCVRGNNLSYGYYNDPERTQKVFVQNPLNDAYKEIIYRTGDIVRINDYNEIEYIGRKDFQIKHMGHRIELGEIEVNISSIPGIDENCCLYDNDHQRIVVFYTGSVTENDLGTKLKSLLPAYMYPSKRIQLDTMPHNLNGKIDRETLKGSCSSKNK